MKEAINASLLYVSTFFDVNVAMFEREDVEFRLPSPYATLRENQTVQRFLTDNSTNMICFIQDRLLVRYCLVIIDCYVALIGPYRIGRISRQDVPVSLFPSESDWKSFFRYYDSLPNLPEMRVHQAALLIFVAIFGGGVDVPKKTIDMQEYDKGKIPAVSADMTADDLPSPTSQEEDFCLQFITAIRSGNYTDAIRKYRHIMKGRGQVFILLNVVEGLSTLRTQINLALSMSGIPYNVYNPLLQQYKMQGRVITSITEATELSEKLIHKSCELVQSFRSKDFSPGIRAAVTYIHSNLSIELSTPILAQKATLSPNRFTTRFHDEVGMTPTAYILRERMNTAAELLAYSNLSIQNIGASVGLLDSNYFTRCFKKHFGMSPSDYRKHEVRVITGNNESNT